VNHLDIVFRSCLINVSAQEMNEFGNQLRFDLSILTAPGAALHFKETAKFRIMDLVQVDEELGVFKANEEAQAVFFNLFFQMRLKVFTVEAQTLRGGSQITAA
jgi:hypothetical protein